jgi:hypothetical protein
MLRTGRILSDESQFLDRILLNRSLRPRAVVGGWLFFEYPRNFSGVAGAAELRLTVTDTAGASTAAIKHPQISKSTDFDSTTYLRGGIKVGHKQIDASTLRIVSFARD